MTKRTKKSAGKKDLDPKSRAKKVKGGINVASTVFDQLNPSDSKNLKRATHDLTLGKVNPQ
jgi:hypothetical protein